MILNQPYDIGRNKGNITILFDTKLAVSTHDALNNRSNLWGYVLHAFCKLFKQFQNIFLAERRIKYDAIPHD